MKLITLIMLAGLAACSSTSDKKSSESKIPSPDAFKKKERPLSNRDVPDYYSANIPAMSPALQDETLDRLSRDEADKAPASADPLMSMSLACGKGNFEEAFATASRAFQKYQKVAAYWNQVANCHLNQGNSRKALLFYNKALEVSPDYAPAMNNIGVLYSRQGQDQKALVAFEKASKSSRFSKTPRYNLARLYLSYGLADEALPIFDGLLSESPKDADLLNGVATAHFIKAQYAEAVGHYKRIPGQLSAEPEVGLNYAWSLGKLGKADEARKVFRSVRVPTNPEQKNYHGAVARLLGENE